MDELKTANAVREENKGEFPAGGEPVTPAPVETPVVPADVPVVTPAP